VRRELRALHGLQPLAELLATGGADPAAVLPVAAGALHNCAVDRTLCTAPSVSHLTTTRSSGVR
jgi:hypothetical protein